MKSARSALLVVLALVFACPALGAWPHGIDVNVPVATGASVQTGTAATSDGAGGMYVAWEDDRNGDDDLYLQRILHDGTVAPGWPANGLAVSVVLGTMSQHRIVADGSGNVFLGWLDSRSGNPDLYLHKVLATGAIAPGWPANGLGVRVAPAVIANLDIAADGMGGVVTAWSEVSGPGFDIVAQRIDAGGGVHAGWGAGVVMCAVAGDQLSPSVATDDSGGVVAAWEDFRAGNWDIYIGRLRHNGVLGTGWPAGGFAACAAVGNQLSPQVLGDGGGGAFIAFRDFRAGIESDIYLAGIHSGGGVGANWPVDGVAVCTAAGNQATARLAPYGDGVLVSWEDDRVAAANTNIYAHAVGNYGVLAPEFPVDGLPVCTAPDEQINPRVVADGAGGVFLAWGDRRAGSYNIFAQRIGPDFQLSNGWPVNGREVCHAANTQSAPVPVLDDTGSLLLAWNDARSGISFDIYAQRMDRFGYLGQPEPAITNVRDVAGDQGGRVRIDWATSWLDADPNYDIESYGIWRQIPAVTAQAAIARGARRVGGTREALMASGRAVRTTMAAGVTFYWEFVESLPARGLPTHSYVAATATDSMDAGNPYAHFMVEAVHENGYAFWFSDSDSGYSVDNVAPSQVQAFSAHYFPGTAPSSAGAAAAAAEPYTWLHWAPVADADFLEFRLHRGATADFVPGPGNLVVAKRDTGHVDAGAPPSHYKLIAVDVHGNRSIAAATIPENTTGVSSAATLSVRFERPRPMPMRAEALLRFELPVTARASLAIFDVGGRSVRVLADGILAAGAHEVVWDRRTSEGEVAPAGIYFARLDVAERRMTQRLVVLGR